MLRFAQHDKRRAQDDTKSNCIKWDAPILILGVLILGDDLSALNVYTYPNVTGVPA